RSFFGERPYDHEDEHISAFLIPPAQTVCLQHCGAKLQVIKGARLYAAGRGRTEVSELIRRT
ncbi:MAG TPA: hypothetical protein VIB79_16395, partial [Candidatus Binatia bacterium]